MTIIVVFQSAIRLIEIGRGGHKGPPRPRPRCKPRPLPNVNGGPSEPPGPEKNITITTMGRVDADLDPSVGP